METDHIVPYSQKKLHGYKNIVTACKECNSKKAAHMLPDDEIRDSWDVVVSRTKKFLTSKKLREFELCVWKADAIHMCGLYKKLERRFWHSVDQLNRDYRAILNGHRLGRKPHRPRTGRSYSITINEIRTSRCSRK